KLSPKLQGFGSGGAVQVAQVEFRHGAEGVAVTGLAGAVEGAEFAVALGGGDVGRAVGVIVGASCKGVLLAFHLAAVGAFVRLPLFVGPGASLGPVLNRWLSSGWHGCYSFRWDGLRRARFYSLHHSLQ